jgi:hypothetical protein
MVRPLVMAPASGKSAASVNKAVPLLSCNHCGSKIGALFNVLITMKKLGIKNRSQVGVDLIGFGQRNFSVAWNWGSPDAWIFLSHDFFWRHVDAHYDAEMAIGR